jgi:hypothetical protein
MNFQRAGHSNVPRQILRQIAPFRVKVMEFPARPLQLPYFNGAIRAAMEPRLCAMTN